MKKLERILIVDDEEDIITIAVMALEALGGYQVSTAINGQDFLDKVENVAPDLILLDVMMPAVDGPTALKKYIEENGDSAKPVVFMTAKTQRHEVESFLSLGAERVLAKPFNPATICTELEQIWADING